MKRISSLCVILFVFSVAVFSIYSFFEFKNKDRIGPVIRMDTDQITVSIHATEEELLAGVTATDIKDGDVTDSLVIESISEFVSQNVRFVNYAAFDQDNHVTKASRKIIYSDYTSPKFKLSEPLRFSMASSSQNLLENISVEDCIEGDISDKINFSTESTIVMSIPSDYPVELQVTNSAGDTVTLPVTLTVYDIAEESSVPKIELEEYLVYTPAGKKIDPISYLKSVTYKGVTYKPTDGEGTYGTDTSNMTPQARQDFLKGEQTISNDYITINDKIDYDKPGTYEIQYFMDGEEGSRGKVNLIVIVEGENNAGEQ